MFNTAFQDITNDSMPLRSDASTAGVEFSARPNQVCPFNPRTLGNLGPRRGRYRSTPEVDRCTLRNLSLLW